MKLQTVVVSSLEQLENSGIIDEMRVFFHDQEMRAKSNQEETIPLRNRTGALLPASQCV